MPKSMTTTLSLRVQHDVLRFQVAMNNAFRMRRFERPAYLHHHGRRLLRFQFAFLLKQMRKALPLDILHGDKFHAIRFRQIVNAAHVLMRHLLSDDQFLLEPVEHISGLRELGSYHLHGHDPLQFVVVHFVDGSHAARAKLLENFVPLSKYAAHAKRFFRAARFACVSGSRGRAAGLFLVWSGL